MQISQKHFAKNLSIKLFVQIFTFLKCFSTPDSLASKIVWIPTPNLTPHPWLDRNQNMTLARFGLSWKKEAYHGYGFWPKRFL